MLQNLNQGVHVFSYKFEEEVVLVSTNCQQKSLMDTISSTTSFHYVMSKFSDLLIKVQQRMDKLRDETREIVDQLQKEYNSEQNNANANYQAEANLKSIIDMAVIELEKQLVALEASCKDSWLRTFLYISNYVSTAVPKIDEGHEEMKRDVIPMHNVMLPDYNDDDFEPTEKYIFNEYSQADLQKSAIHSKACRRPSELLKEVKFCFNEER